ncbi:fumarylacetoacetate hydrolase family protein [Nonomuraea sp. NBC_01738]|uniref:fumarylacetoacetate hydrolase family protein n=1 Tax=Nonomuraea sp. NBC_01738 TaxID=2976003 RepID=UPI002E1169E5|nr:fumarylacetoacetate hydrolase family protein [Nonomuraea sp. NBC_01738]
MKLLRVGPVGQERPVVMDAAGNLRDIGEPEIDGAFLASGGVARVRDALESGDLPVVDADGLRVGAPVARPGKIVCIGLNYSDHAEETGATPPPEPVVFMKAANTMIGPDDQVLVPRNSVKTDWEVELAVVIGKTARYLDSREAALDVIAGYAISNDVSEREFQLERAGQWDKGKSCETFNPMGPWFVTADEIGDPQNLAMRLWVNGELRQDGNSKNMIFDIAEVVRYLSQFMVLEPGDVINTGTPAGVAMGLPGQPYLREGDVMELEIEGLGRQRQTVGQA